MKPSAIFVLLAFLLPAARAADAGDAPPAPANATVQLECDWLLVPLTELPNIVPQQLTSACDASALRKAIEPLLASGTARRLDFSSLEIADGKTGNLEARREMTKAADWRAEPGEDGGFTLQPSRSEFSHLGTEISAEAAVSADNRTAMMQLAITRTERIADTVWKEGANEIRLPVLSRFSLEGARIPLLSGQWALAACAPYYTAAEKELPLEKSPDASLRLLIFLRATVKTARPAGAPGEIPAASLLLCEWIETTPGIAASLTAKHDPLTAGTALRAAVQQEIAAGHATVADYSVAPLGSGNSIKTAGTWTFSWPITMDIAGAIADGKANKAARKPGAEVKPPPPGNEPPPTRFEFQERTNAGTTLEVEATRLSDPLRWDLTLAPEIIRLHSVEPLVTGADIHAFQRSMPRCVSWRSNGEVFVAPGSTVLARVQEARDPMPAGDGDGTAVPRKVMLMFVRVVE